MRKTTIAGNWKMNLGFHDSLSLYTALKTIRYDDKQTEIIVAPTALYLSQFAMANTSTIGLAAQNVSDKESGAYTGEWSAAMLENIKMDYCIVGHSERRQYFGDTDQSVGTKARLLLDHGIIPIICCGETLEERQAGDHISVVNRQVGAGLAQLKPHEIKKSIIAYEPVWAIGTGETASPEQAQEMHEFIRGVVLSLHDSSVSEEVRILYGGSVKPENARLLFAKPDIDGGLVGGASLKFESFKDIIEAAF